MSRRLTVIAAAILAAVSCSADDNNSGFVDVFPDRVADYVTDAKPALRIELDTVSAFEPSADVQATVIEHIEPLLQKPEGVTIVKDDTLESRSGHGWTFAELQILANSSFGGTSSTEAVVHVMVVDGYYADSDGTTFGLAWSNRHIALFAESIRGVCEPDGGDELRRRGLVEKACAASLTGTWVHEFGHVIGLVNNGLEMVEVHNDPNHPTHSADPDSIMYWQFDVAAAFDAVRGKVLDDEDPIPPFDEACLADIEAARTTVE